MGRYHGRLCHRNTPTPFVFNVLPKIRCTRINIWCAERMRIRLEDLMKRYQHTIAVNHLNLEINDGEFLIVLGSSGSGKSTTLNMLAGLEIPTSGYIFSDELMVNQIPPGKRDVALVFQNYALYPHMKSYDTIAFPLRIRKEKDLRQKVIKTAEMLGLMLYCKSTQKNFPVVKGREWHLLGLL